MQLLGLFISWATLEASVPGEVIASGRIFYALLPGAFQAGAFSFRISQ